MHVIDKQMLIYFVALENKGFSHMEALRIVMAHGANPGMVNNK
jgi:hypothetical protein